MRTILILIILFVSSDSNAWFWNGKKNDCDKSMAQLNKILSGDSQRYAFDSNPSSLKPDMQELRRVLLNSDPHELEYVFSQVSKEDLARLKEAIEGGKVKITDKSKRRFLTLMEFIDQDKHDVFWSQDPRASLQSRYPEFAGSTTQTKLGGTIGGKDTSSLTSLEKEIVAAALGESSRVGRGGILTRAIVPTYYPTKRILSFNNIFRDQLEHVDEGKRALTGAEAQYPNMNSEEKNLLQEGLGLMDELKKGATKKLEDAYQQDITTGGVVVNKNIDLYAISDRIKKVTEKLEKSTKLADHEELAAEAAMDKLDEAAQKMKARLNEPARTKQEYMDGELKIRHRQHQRNKNGSLNKLSSALDENGNESVSIYYSYKKTEYYYETEHYTDSKGNRKSRQAQKSRQVTKHATDTVYPSFGDILDDRLSSYVAGHSTPSGTTHSGTIITVTGKSEIVNASSKAAELEAEFRKPMRNVNSMINDLIENHVGNMSNAKSDATIKAVMQKKIDDLEKELVKVEEIAKKHAKLSDDELYKIWVSDTAKNFRARNQATIEAIENLKKLTNIYSEQWRRGQFEVRIIADIPDYSKDLNKLGWKAFRTHTAQGVLATTPFIGGATFYTQCLEKYKTYSNYSSEYDLEKAVRICSQDLQNMFDELLDKL